DFDDLLLRMALLLRDRPELREALAQRFRYIMIDEYQDTNHAQYLLAHAIAAYHQNLCDTGDPDQSIYAWRGADIRNILEFEHDYPQAKVVLLEENYRSTSPILKAASRLISHNRDRKAKSLWTSREGGAEVKVVGCDDEHAEAQIVARRVADYARAGGDLNGVAVFYRVNSLSRVIEEALLKQGVPYRIARGVEFYNRKEIRDVIAYLRLIANPADDVSCDRIINTPSRGIGKTTVDRLTLLAAQQQMSLLDACRQGELAGCGKAATKKALAFADMIGQLAAGAENQPVKQIIEDVYRESGLEESYSGSDEDSRQGRANIEELISTAAEFDAVDGGTLLDYLYQVSLVSDIDHFEGGQGAATLMTLHAAKGLEFPVVFVIGCEEGLLPFIRQSGGPGSSTECNMEEERRLAFVGMTRARDQLILTHVQSRMMRGRTTPQAASPFLDEIRGDMVTFEDETTDLSTPQRRRGRAGFRGGFAGGGGGFYGETQTREQIEAQLDAMEQMQEQPEFPPEYEYLREGCRVHHSKFGTGKVVKIRHPWPQTRAEVLFDDFGPKTLVLNKTSLEVEAE
ncbi:MAG: ATP-dependent helicase, partial [Planctomycetota bacterium]